MQTHIYAGIVPADRPADVQSWADTWLQLANEAKIEGAQLLIFRVSEKMTGNSQVYSQPVEDVDPMLFDNTFLASI